MIVSINQPGYLPWLGALHRIAVSDVHVVLDHVQFEKDSFINRNKVRTKPGWTWLTVPVRTRGKFGELPIDEVEIADDPRWMRTHWETLRMNYARAPHFAEHAAFFEETYQRPWRRLAELLDHTTRHLLDEFGIRTRCVRSSEMGPTGRKSDLVLDICRALDARTYYSGALGRQYLDEMSFADAGVRIVYQEYVHPVYRQTFPGFESRMSALDLLANHGAEAKEIIMQGNLTKAELEAREVST